MQIISLIHTRKKARHNKCFAIPRICSEEVLLSFLRVRLLTNFENDRRHIETSVFTYLREEFHKHSQNYVHRI